MERGLPDPEKATMTNEQGVRCHVCGGTRYPGTTTYASAGETPVLVTNVPALICRQCGAAGFPSQVAAEIERLVTERPVPTRTIAVPVYELAEGRYEAPAAATRK